MIVTNHFEQYTEKFEICQKNNTLNLLNQDR